MRNAAASALGGGWIDANVPRTPPSESSCSDTLTATYELNAPPSDAADASRRTVSMAEIADSTVVDALAANES